jgi:hypothetical protein
MPQRHSALLTNEVEMNKTLLASAVVVTWSVATPFAQQQPAPSSATEPAHKVLVLTGCLSGGAATTPAFKLTDVSPLGQATPGRATDAGAVGTSGQKESYELQPVSGLESKGLDADALKSHVGKRVEMVVRPIESLAPPPATGLAEAQAPKQVEPRPQRFSVTEIRRVIGNCEQ